MDQATLSEDGLLYDIQWMPSNWVGSHVLEQLHVPYVHMKTNELGILERIGNWMRFTTKHNVAVGDREHIWKKIKGLEEEPCLINLTMGMAPVKSLQLSLQSSLQLSPKHSLKRFHQKRATFVQ